jgi:hypothetical protein
VQGYGRAVLEQVRYMAGQVWVRARAGIVVE